MEGTTMAFPSSVRVVWGTSLQMRGSTTWRKLSPLNRATAPSTQPKPVAAVLVRRVFVQQALLQGRGLRGTTKGRRRAVTAGPPGGGPEGDGWGAGEGGQGPASGGLRAVTREGMGPGRSGLEGLLR